MKISIKLKNKQEIIKDFTEEEYNALKKIVMSGKLRKIEIEDQIIDCDLIAIIEPINEPDLISKKFRLPEPELRKIDNIKGMKTLFDKLKDKGLFQEFNSYEEWCETKYPNL